MMTRSSLSPQRQSLGSAKVVAGGLPGVTLRNVCSAPSDHSARQTVPVLVNQMRVSGLDPIGVCVAQLWPSTVIEGPPAGRYFVASFQ